MSNSTSLKGGKVCLRDFKGNEKGEASKKLTDAGFALTPAFKLADIIVVPDVPSKNTEQRANNANIPVMSLDEVLELGGLEEIQDLEIDEAREIEFTDDTGKVKERIIFGEL